MGKGNAKRNKGQVKPAEAPPKVANDANTLADKKEEFGTIFRPLDRDTPKVLLGLTTDFQGTAPSVYHDAQSSKGQASGKTTSTNDWDSGTDRSSSPFEIIDDEASRDLARTPSQDFYYDVEELKGPDDRGFTLKHAASEKQPFWKNVSQHTGKKKRDGNRHEEPNAAGLKGDESGEQQSQDPKAGDNSRSTR